MRPGRSAHSAPALAHARSDERRHNWGADGDTSSDAGGNTAPAYATFNFIGRSGYSNYVTSYSMGPNNQQVIPLSTVMGGTSWVGSLHMTSDQPVALRLFDGAGSSNGRSYNATAVGRTLIFVPAAYRAYGGFTTAIYIQNLSSTASTNVTLRYCASQVTDPSSCPTTGPTAIAPRTAIGVNLAAAPVPDGWAGSVSIQSSGSVPISAVFSNGNAEDAYSVSATGYGSKLIILPRAAKNAGGRTTGFTIRNVSGQNNVNVVARYYAGDGTLTWTRPTIVLNSAQVFGAHQSLDSGIPAGWEGSIVLEASYDIIAIIREETGTTLAAYNGVSR